MLEGWDREFPSLRELLDVLKGCTLKSGEENFTVKRCCPPKPGGRAGDRARDRERADPGAHGASSPLFPEISDLLITRKEKDNGKQILNLTQLSFHQIRKNEITQVPLSGDFRCSDSWDLPGGVEEPALASRAPGMVDEASLSFWDSQPHRDSLHIPGSQSQPAGWICSFIPSLSKEKRGKIPLGSGFLPH